MRRRSIGTGVTASPEQAQETHAAIRKWIAANVSAEVADGIRIQYGGSANAKNAPDLSAQPDIDGFLAGGAVCTPCSNGRARLAAAGLPQRRVTHAPGWLSHCLSTRC